MRPAARWFRGRKGDGGSGLLFGFVPTDGSSLLRSSLPVVVETVHTVWPDITQRLLVAFYCLPYLAADGRTVGGRLLLDPDVVCYESPEHWPIVGVATAGIALFSVGLQAWLFLRLKILGASRQRTENLVLYGYLHIGLDPRYWWRAQSRK